MLLVTHKVTDYVNEQAANRSISAITKEIDITARCNMKCTYHHF